MTAPEAATGAELFDRTQRHLVGLARHRAEFRNENAAEKRTRQRHRAEAMAHSLGSTRPSVVKAMLAMIVADETINPKGDPPPPTPPGARATLKPNTRAKGSGTDATSPAPVPEPPSFWFDPEPPVQTLNTPEQGSFW